MSGKIKTSNSRIRDEEQLQKYLHEKNLDDFFVELVEELLIDAPDNPVKFMIDYLVTHYPEQASESSFSKTFSRKSVIGGGGIILTGIAEVEDDSSNCDDAQQESKGDDSDSDDDIDDMIALEKLENPRFSKGRRISVCGESINPATMSSSEKVEILKKHEKDDVTKKSLEDMLKHNILFSHLHEKQVHDIIDSMFPVSYTLDHVIIRQGDDGDNFYVVKSGECEISIENADGSMSKVMIATAGDSFGELSLMYNAPRAATVKAISQEVELYALNRASFKLILLDSAIKSRESYKSFIDNVPILQSLTETEKLTLVDALKYQVFKKGDTIITQHEEGDKFFMIMNGEVVCTQQAGPYTSPVEVARLTKNDYFGEISLLTTRPRAATIKALTEQVECISLQRAAFFRLFGSLTDILKRNMSAYKKFISDKI